MNKTIKIILWLVVAIIVTAGIWYGVSKKPTVSTTKEPIKIGFIGPLSGDVAAAGETERNVIEMAIKEISDQGGINGRKLEVIYEDSKCDGKEAATAIQKLINVDRVKIVLGGCCSSETLGAAPIAEQNKVILFSAFSSNPKISEAGDYIFRNTPSDSEGGKVAATMIKEKKVAVISENIEYAQGVREVFKQEFPKLGGEIVGDEVFTPGEKDFRSYLIKIKSKNPEALFVNPKSPSAAGLIIKQARELGMNVPIYGNFILGSKDTLDIAGKLANGVVFFDTPTLDLKNPKAASFLNKYKSLYGEPFNELQAGSRYDSVYIIANALKKCGEDTECIKNYLYNMDWYDGVIGRYKFDQNGDAVGLKFVIKEIIDGKVVERK